TKKADATNGDTTGKQTVSAATHTVGETAGTASTLTDYTSAIDCKDRGGAGLTIASSSDAGPLNVTVAAAADVVCTITNTRKPPTPTGGHFQCNGVFTGISAHDVTVPAGGACQLINSTVKDDVRVLKDAYFQATNTSVGDDVKGKRAQTIFL